MYIVVKIAMAVQHVFLDVHFVMVVVMIAMMYIVGVNCLLLITEAAELVMENNV